MDKIAFSKLLDYYGNLLTAYQKEILRQYYDCDMSLFEISEEYDISRQAVSDVIRRASDKLTDADGKLQIIAHAERVSAALIAFEEKWSETLPVQAREEMLEIITSAREI